MELKEKVKAILYDLAIEQMTTGATELQSMQRITGVIREDFRQLQLLMGETTTEIRGNRAHIGRKVQKYVLHVFHNLFRQQFKSKPIIIYDTKVEGKMIELGNWVIVVSNEMGIGIRENNSSRTKLIHSMNTLYKLYLVHEEIAKRLKIKGFQKQADNLVKMFELMPNPSLIAEACIIKLPCEKKLCVVLNGKIEELNSRVLVFSRDAVVLEGDTTRVTVNPATFNGWMCWQELKEEWSEYVQQTELLLMKELQKTRELRKHAEEAFGSYLLGAKL